MRETEITPIRVAELELPPNHPEGPGRCEVLAFLVRDGGANFLVDTGVGEGNDLIDALYKPRRSPLLQVLAEHGVGPGDLSAIANSHLHFDHCGNNRLFPGVPIFAQEAEYEAARAEHYTVPSWIEFPGADYRIIQGRHRLSPGVELVPTPGHTPGHQSVLVETASGPQLVVGQAAYSSAEFASWGSAAAVPRQDAWSPAVYADSLGLLHALGPARAFFSHDSAAWERAA